jgi:hypothetical protein
MYLYLSIFQLLMLCNYQSFNLSSSVGTRQSPNLSSFHGHSFNLSSSTIIFKRFSCETMFYAKMWIPLFLVSSVDTFVTFCIYSVVYSVRYSVHWDFLLQVAPRTSCFNDFNFFPSPNFFNFFPCKLSCIVSIFMDSAPSLALASQWV